MYRPKLTSFLILFLSVAMPIHAAEKKEKVSNVFSFSSGGPLSISSDNITVKGLENKISFEGAVSIKKGDMTILAGQADVFLSTQETKEITRIELSDAVDLKQGSRHVLAQNGVYDAQRGEIIFSGKAEMWEKGYYVKGKVITLSLTQKRTVMEKSHLIID